MRRHKCFCCHKKISGYHDITMEINGEIRHYCPVCAKTVKDDIHSFTVNIPISHEKVKEKLKKITLYYKVNPAYFAKANKVKIEYTYKNDTMSYEDWQLRGALDLLASALGHSGNYGYAMDEIKKDNPKAIEIFRSIDYITKEEFEKI